jgi:hypothetical protein
MMAESRTRFLRIFFFGLFFSCIFSLFQLTGWSPLVRWHIKGQINFGDLNSVLGSADCYQAVGFDVYSFPIGHECAYNYGSWLMRSISFIGLGERHTQAVGLIFIVLISCLLAFVMAQVKLGRSSLFLGLIIFVSPPIMLLLERGNLDILMFILIFLAAENLSKSKVNASLVLLVVSMLYKFYTVGLATLVAFMSRSTIIFFYWLAIIVLAMIQIFNDFRRGPGFINTDWASFGAPIFGIYLAHLNVTIPFLLSLALGCSILLVAVWFVSRAWTPFYKLYKELTTAPLESIPSYHLFIFFSAVHTTCYVLGTNFDYRLIMLAIANFILLSQANLRYKTNLVVGLATVLIMWTSYNIGILQPIGDILIGVTTAYYICINWQFFQKLPMVVKFKESRPELFHKFL